MYPSRVVLPTWHYRHPGMSYLPRTSNTIFDLPRGFEVKDRFAVHNASPFLPNRFGGRWRVQSATARTFIHKHNDSQEPWEAFARSGHAPRGQLISSSTSLGSARSRLIAAVAATMTEPRDRAISEAPSRIEKISEVNSTHLDVLNRPNNRLPAAFKHSGNISVIPAAHDEQSGYLRRSVPIPGPRNATQSPVAAFRAGALGNSAKSAPISPMPSFESTHNGVGMLVYDKRPILTRITQNSAPNAYPRSIETRTSMRKPSAHDGSAAPHFPAIGKAAIPAAGDRYPGGSQNSDAPRLTVPGEIWLDTLSLRDWMQEFFGTNSDLVPGATFGIEAVVRGVY